VAQSALINITENITGLAASRRSPVKGEKHRLAAWRNNTMKAILDAAKIILILSLE